MTTSTPGIPTTPTSSFAVFWRRSAAGRTALLYLLPALLVMLVMTFYPLAFQVWMSFTDYGSVKDGNKTFQTFNPNGGNYRAAQWVGADNYTKIITNDKQFVAQLGTNFNFLGMVGFNLWWTFSNVFFHVTLGVIIAVILNTEGLWLRRIYRTIYILPMVIPSIVIATVWRNMFDDKYGAINMILKLITGPFGISSELLNIRWFNQVADPIAFIPLPLSYYAMLIANIWLGWPFMTIVATGALQSIPKDMYEAADIDGATRLQQFWNITLPLLRPAMIPAAMVGMVMTFNLFHVIYFMSGGAPLGRTEILVTQAFKLININRLYGTAAAFCVFIALILMPIFLFTNYVSRATESYDA